MINRNLLRGFALMALALGFGLPSLSYSLVAGQLTLSWPADATGYVLESTDNLSGGVWSPVNGVVNNQVTVNASTGNKFFRLKR